MRRPRISLRVLLILVALLPMLIGMLWRCGQLDGSMGKDEVFSIRLFSVRASLYPGCFQLATVTRWVNWKTVPPPRSDIFPAYALFPDATSVREWHPWDGRDWQEYSTCQCVMVDWGGPFMGATQGSVEQHWISLRLYLRQLFSRK